MKRHKKVVAVVVTYQPDLEILFRLLSALKGQVDEIVIVDNGSEKMLFSNLAEKSGEFMHRISLGTNLGIAAAQNIGINWARERSADYIVLFDQDSEPAHDMVSIMLSMASEMEASGVPIAAMGPRYFDERQDNPPPFIKVKGLKVERQSCPFSNCIVEVDYLIASGCLIPMSTLDKIGGMREDLFIDYVDIEWGLRAKYNGFQSFGVCAATMKHDLGDEPIEFMGRKIPLHSPLRHYYHFRNAIWMYRQNWLPLHWKLADGWRLILKYGFYTLFAKPRLKHLRMMTLGVWHGTLGQMGKFNNDW